jgi:hypothetical protein
MVFKSLGVLVEEKNKHLHIQNSVPKAALVLMSQPSLSAIDRFSPLSQVHLSLNAKKSVKICPAFNVKKMPNLPWRYLQISSGKAFVCLQY